MAEHPTQGLYLREAFLLIVHRLPRLQPAMTHDRLPNDGKSTGGPTSRVKRLLEHCIALPAFQGYNTMMAHPNKHIRKAIEYAESQGWRFVKSGPRAHAYGVLYCPFGRGGCKVSVFGTPRSPENHAVYIYTKVDRCPH